MLIRPQHRCWYANVGSHMLMSLRSWWWLVKQLIWCWKGSEERVLDNVSMFQKSFILMCIDELFKVNGRVELSSSFQLFCCCFFAVARVWAFFPSLTAGSVLLTSIVPESCRLLAAVQKTIWWIWQLAAFALLEKERATDKRRYDEGSFCLVWSRSSDTLIEFVTLLLRLKTKRH